MHDARLYQPRNAEFRGERRLTRRLATLGPCRLATAETLRLAPGIDHRSAATGSRAEDLAPFVPRAIAGAALHRAVLVRQCAAPAGRSKPSRTDPSRTVLARIPRCRPDLACIPRRLPPYRRRAIQGKRKLDDSSSDHLRQWTRSALGNQRARRASERDCHAGRLSPAGCRVVSKTSALGRKCKGAARPRRTSRARRRKRGRRSRCSGAGLGAGYRLHSDRMATIR